MTTTDAMLDELEEFLKASVSEVFKTMLDLKVESVAADSLSPSTGEQVAGSVGFTGEASGVVYIHASDAFARQMTSRMLGLSEAEIEGHEMVNDAIGELSNMIVGAVKSRLCDRGLPCVLTIPSIVRGQSISVEMVGAIERRVLGFRAGENQLLIELLIKPSSQ